MSVNQVSLHPKEDVSLPPFADAYSMLEREKTQRASFDEDDSLDTSDNSDDNEERDLLGEMELKARIMITGGDSKEEAVMIRADRLTIRRAIILAAEEKQAAGSKHIVLTEDVVAALNTLAVDEASTPKRRERTQDMADAMALYCSGTAGHFLIVSVKPGPKPMSPLWTWGCLPMKVMKISWLWVLWD